MKRVIFSLSIICLLFGLGACKSKSKKQVQADAEVVAVENARDNLNWVGSYSGVVPCADCQGILTQITLNADNTYQISWKYQGKNDEAFKKSGTFQWDAEGNTITLEGLDSGQYPFRYKVGEEHLLQLDLEGNVITGEFAEKYMISKFSNF